LGQMSRVVEQTEHRERNAAILNEALSQVPGIVPQPGEAGMSRRAYHLYPLRIESEGFGCSRAKFIEACAAEGLPMSAGYPLPLYKQPFVKQIKGYDYSGVSCPVTEDLCYRSGCWFHHALLLGTEEDMNDIVRIIQKVKDNA